MTKMSIHHTNTCSSSDTFISIISVIRGMSMYNGNGNYLGRRTSLKLNKDEMIKYIYAENQKLRTPVTKEEIIDLAEYVRVRAEDEGISFIESLEQMKAENNERMVRYPKVTAYARKDRVLKSVGESKATGFRNVDEKEVNI